MTFASRQDAGRRLGNWLRDSQMSAEIVAGLPRGGVVVAAEVARALRCPLRALVVRKVGHPFHREFAVGALAEGGVIVLDENSIGADPRAPEALKQVIHEEMGRLSACERIFRQRDQPGFSDRQVFLVDDGLATGATMEAAVRSARKQGARRVVVAVPVASPAAVERLRSAADDVAALCVDPDFVAVGSYYRYFDQTTDDEVVELLQQHLQI